MKVIFTFNFCIGIIYTREPEFKNLKIHPSLLLKNIVIHFVVIYFQFKVIFTIYVKLIPRVRFYIYIYTHTGLYYTTFVKKNFFLTKLLEKSFFHLINYNLYSCWKILLTCFLFTLIVSEKYISFNLDRIFSPFFILG